LLALSNWATITSRPVARCSCTVLPSRRSISASGSVVKDFTMLRMTGILSPMNTSDSAYWPAPV